MIGDEILVLIAQTLANRVRETDAVCRWGGEEFIALLPRTTLQSAVLLAESLRQAIEAISKPHLPPMTVSVGVAQHQDDESTESLIKRADDALYEAKNSGRNKVVML